MPSSIVSNKELKLATGFDKNSALEKCLRAQKVAILYGKNGQVFTTIDALNAALGIKSADQPTTNEIEFI